MRLRLFGAVVAAFFAAIFAWWITTDSISSALNLYSRSAAGAPKVGSGVASNAGQSEAASASPVAVGVVWMLFGLFALGGVLIADRQFMLTNFRALRPNLAGTGVALILLPAALVVSQTIWSYWAPHSALLRGPSGDYANVAQVGDQAEQTTSLHAVVVAFWTSIGAGIGEEVCMLAVPVWLAGYLAPRLGQRSRRVLTILGICALIGVRIAYHAYLGPISVFYLPWAAAAVLLYLRIRLLLPLIVAHFLYDFVAGLLRPVDLHSGWQYAGATIVIFAVPGIAALMLAGGTLALARTRGT